MNTRSFALLAVTLLLSSCGGGDSAVSTGLKIFATARTHNGSILGDQLLLGDTVIEKADYFCQTDANKPPDGGTYKALLVDGMTRDALVPLDWVLKPNTNYYQAENNVLIAKTTDDAIFPQNLDNYIHESFGTGGDPDHPPPTSAVWTGFADGYSFTTNTDTCSGWTYEGQGEAAPYGESYGTDGSELWNNGAQVCLGVARLYCVEQ